MTFKSFEKKKEILSKIFLATLNLKIKNLRIVTVSEYLNIPRTTIYNLFPSYEDFIIELFDFSLSIYNIKIDKRLYIKNYSLFNKKGFLRFFKNLLSFVGEEFLINTYLIKINKNLNSFNRIELQINLINFFSLIHLLEKFDTKLELNEIKTLLNLREDL